SDGDFVDRAGLLAFVPDDLRQFAGIERRPSASGRGRWRSGRRVTDQIQTWFYAACQVCSLSHPVNVHEIDVRVVPEKMVVKCGHIDSIIEKRRHDGIHFLLKQHKIAHHHVGSVTGFGQSDPAAESEWRRRRESLDRHLQIVAWNIYFENARLEVAFTIQSLENILVIGWRLLREGTAS